MEENIEPSKKSIFKRWWFWVILGVIVFGFTFAWISGHNQSTKHDEEIKQEQNSQHRNTSDSRKKAYGIVADFTPPSKAGFNYGGPTIVNDFIYIGTASRIPVEIDPAENIAAIPTNYFYKMDLDLKPIWSYEMGKTMTAGGAVLDSKGNIYFATEDFSPSAESKSKGGLKTDLHLVSLTGDGKFRWKKPISRAGGEDWMHATVYPAIGTDDTVYVADNKLFAFDSEGAIKWQYPQGNETFSGMRSAPIIDKTGAIYLVAPEANLQNDSSEKMSAHKFNPGGQKVWSTLLDNQIMDPEGPYKGSAPNGGGHKENQILSSPAFSVGEKYLYVPVGSTINKVDAASGKIAWSTKPEGATGSFKSNPSVDGQDNIYIGTKSNDESTLFALNASGKIIWKKLIGGDLYPTPILGDDGKLYVLSEQGKGGEEESIIFRLVDTKTGESSGKIDDKGPLAGGGFSASVIYKGYFYNSVGSVTDDQGNVMVVALAKRKVAAEDYPTDSPWPKGHGRNDNSGHSNN